MSQDPFETKKIEHAPLPIPAQKRRSEEYDPSAATPLPFPWFNLPPVCLAMAGHITMSTLVPISLAASAIIGVISAALGSGLEVESGGDRRTRGNLFILPIAQTGTGKDESLKFAAKPLFQVEHQAQSQWDQNILPGLKTRTLIAQKQIKTLEKAATGKGEDNAKELEAAFREVDLAENDLNSRPVFCTTDATREAIVACLGTQAGESLAVITAEGRGAVSNILGRYTKGNASDEDLYCACHSGTPINQQRRTKESINLARPCLTMLVMVQPDVWKSLSAMDNLRESGLLPRFLFFDAKAESDPLPLKPHCIPADVSDEYTELIRSLCEAYRLHKGDAHCIKCPEEAYGVLWAFDNECRARRRTGGDMNDIAGFVARWAEQAWRISVVLHAMEHGGDAHNHPLSVETAKYAITLTRWFVQEQLGLLNEGRQKMREERFQKLVDILIRKGGELSLRDLKNSHGFDRKEVLALTRDHPDTFQHYTEQVTTGRPSQLLKLLRPYDNTPAKPLIGETHFNEADQKPFACGP